MASTDYDFILTRNELIEESYRKVGVLSDYQTILASQLATANIKLNLILKEWSENGVKLWTQIIETGSTVDDQSYISIPDTNGMSYVSDIFVTDNDNEYQLDRISKRQYEAIPDKECSGKPTMFWQDVISERVVLWPVPDAVYPVRILGVKKLKDWETEDDTGELAARWQNAIKYALAVEIAEDYQMSLQMIQDLRIVALAKYKLAMDKEYERSSFTSVRGAFG